MKRMLSAFLTLVMVIGILTSVPVSVSAASVSDLTFKKYDYSSYYVADCSETASGKLVIPATYKGLPVEYIYPYAFSGCTNLTSITIPDSVTSISDYAFYDCTSLKSITIPDSVTSIGSSAFSDCTSLTSITIPGSVTSIGECAFRDCTSLKTIKLSQGVKSIGDSAFYYCISLISIEIPDSVISIGEEAFYNCTNLTSIEIPDSVTSIGDSAFRECSGLLTVTVGNGVKSIGNSAFYNCTSLTAVYIVDVVAWCSIEFGSNYSNPLYYAGNLYINGELAIDIVIPDSVTSIGSYVFYGCKSLKSLTIPDSVTSVGYSSFFCCKNLTAVTMGNSVTILKKKSFYGCASLSELTIGKKVETIDEEAFYGCTSLESVTIPDGVTLVGGSSFSNCTSLKSVNIGSNVTTIDSGAFSSCKNLESVIIPNSVTILGGAAFRYCESLKSVKIGASVESINYATFDGCTDLTSVKIGKGVTNIDEYAFKNCSSLKSITIPGNVKSIGEYAFYNCDNLKNVTISEGVTSIEQAFVNCPSITGVTIPSSVTSIDTCAFCTKTVSGYHEYYNLADYVIYGYKNSYAQSFAEKNNIPFVVLDASDDENNLGGRMGSFKWSLDKRVGVLEITGSGKMIDFSNVAAPWYEYKDFVTEISLPSDITYIGAKAFDGLYRVVSVTIPTKVKGIGDNAFYKCKRLASLKNGKGLKSIGNYAFYGTGFTDMVIPESVTSIGDYAFYTCKNLTSITIPDSVTTIGMYAFYECRSLEKVYITSVGKWCGIYFKDTYSNPLIYGAELYLNEKKVTNLVIPDSVSSISPYAFYGVESLKSVKIGKSVFVIGDSAFGECKNIEKIYINNGIEQWCEIEFKDTMSNPICYGADLYLNGKKVTDIDIGDSVSRIDPFAFRGYKSLKSVKIGNGVQELPNCVFMGCTELVSVTIPYTVKIIGSNAFHSCSSLEEVAIYSKDCTFSGSCGLNYNQIIYGYKGSTAQKLAEEVGAWFKDIETVHSHTYKTTTVKATLTSNGSVKTVCSVCGNVKTDKVIRSPKDFTLSTTSYTYNGKVKKPSVTVKDSKGNTLKKDTDYTVKYESGRKLPGKYTVTVTFKGKYSGTKKLYFTIAPKAPTKLKASQTTTTITLSWAKVSDATGYRVYMYNSQTKKYEKVKDVTATKLKITKLEAGTKYRFKVKAYTKDGSTIWSADSSVLATATKTKTPSITSLTSSTKGKAVIKWSNVSGETGYQVYYSTSKTGTYKKLASYDANKTTGTKSKLTSGKTYYFKVRAYKKTDSGTVYSSWSSVKSVKIK